LTFQQLDNSSDQKTANWKLGQKIKTYPSVQIKKFRWGLIIGGVALIIFSFIFIVIYVIRLIDAINQHGRAILISQSLPVLILFFVIVPLGLLILIFGIDHWHDSFILYKNGFSRQKGKNSQTWMWSEITSLDSKLKEVVFAGSTVDNLEEVRLKDQDNHSLTIKNRNQMYSELISTIRQKTLPWLHKRMVIDLRNGKMIQFHDNLKVKLYGVEVNGIHYPWSEISFRNRKNGTFELITQTNKEPIYQQKFRNIENFDTLTHLIKNPPTKFISTPDNTSYAEDVRPGQYIER